MRGIYRNTAVEETTNIMKSSHRAYSYGFPGIFRPRLLHH